MKIQRYKNFSQCFFSLILSFLNRFSFFFLKGAEIEDLEHCSQLLVKSMIIREKYMVLSQQSFPFTTAKYLNKVFSEDQNRRTSIRSHDLTEEDFLEQNQKNDGKSQHFLYYSLIPSKS